MIRISCVVGINIVHKKDVIVVKGLIVDVNQASGDKRVASQSIVFLKGEFPTIIIKLRQEKVKSLKTVPWNYGGSTSNVTKDEEVVANIKRTLDYSWIHQSRKKVYPTVELSKEYVKDFLKKMNHKRPLLMKI